MGTGWIDDIEAFCFTAILGLRADEVIRRLGGDPFSAATNRTFDECFWPATGPQWAQVGQVGEGLLVAEHNGFRGEESAEALSRGAVLASVFRNVRAGMRFVFAVDGQVAVDLHPRRPAQTLELMEELTGIRVKRAWLATPQPAVAFPPLR